MCTPSFFSLLFLSLPPSFFFPSLLCFVVLVCLFCRLLRFHVSPALPWMPCFARAAIQILTFVSKANLNIRDDLAWALYMIEYRVKYMGRGLPLPFDVELSISAKETAEDGKRKGAP